MSDTGPLRPAPGRGPIFIVSAMGSGSTLLRLILDSHDRIAIPQETGFMRAYNAHQFVPLKWSGRNWAQAHGLEPRGARRGARRVLRAHLPPLRRAPRQAPLGRQDAAAHVARRRRWRACSRTRCSSAIVRHPGGSVGSNMSRFGHSFSRAVTHVDKYDREIARQAARHGDRFAVVRYEELVLRPEPRAARAARLARRAVVATACSSTTRCRSGAAAGSPSRARTGSTTRSTSRGSTSGTGRCPRPSAPALARRLGRLAEFYGYSMDDPAVLEPLPRRRHC